MVAGAAALAGLRDGPVCEKGLDGRVPLARRDAGGGDDKRIGDAKAEVLLSNIAEQIPTEAVIFDVSTDRGIRTGNQSITEIMYRLFLKSLGYARDLDLSELEITLEEAGRLDPFKAKYRETFNKELERRQGADRHRRAAGKPRHARAGSGDVPDGG